MSLQHLLLASSSLLGFSFIPTLATAPDGAGEGGAPAGGGVENLVGGTQRYTPTGAEAEAAAANAKAAGGTAPELKEGAPAEPQLPEGYDSWEAYGRAVAEGKVEAPAKEPAKEAPKELDPNSFEAKSAPFTEEFEKNGALSDESIKKAAETFGVTEDVVRQYIAGGAAEAAQAQAPFFEQAGGADQYKAFQTWASDGMTAAEQAELNEAYDKGGPGALAVQQKFVDRWKAEGNGAPAEDLTRTAQGGQPAAQTGFRSMAEQKAAQSDPRYANDPAFRKDVEDRIARSTGY